MNKLRLGLYALVISLASCNSPKTYSPPSKFVSPEGNYSLSVNPIDLGFNQVTHKDSLAFYSDTYNSASSRFKVSCVEQPLPIEQFYNLCLAEYIKNVPMLWLKDMMQGKLITFDNWTDKPLEIILDSTNALQGHMEFCLHPRDNDVCEKIYLLDFVISKQKDKTYSIMTLYDKYDIVDKSRAQAVYAEALRTFDVLK